MSVYVRGIADSLAALGTEVDIYTVGQGDQDVVDLSSGVRIHYVDIGKHSVTKDRLDESVPLFGDLVAEHVQRSGGTDVLHSHYWLSGLVGHRLKHDLGVPLVSTFHTLGRVKARTGVVVEPHRRLEEESVILGCSDAVVVSTSVEAADLRDAYGVEGEGVHVIAPGVDHDLFHPGDADIARDRVGLPVNRPVVIFAGRIQPIKGLDVAIHAVARLREVVPDVMFVIIGEPSGEDGSAALRGAHDQVDRLGLARNVRFVGAQVPEAMADYYRASDVCIMPSHSESFGLVALEAAACGVPVVASAVGGLRVVVDHGRTGYLVERGDVAGFAAALQRVLAESNEATSMGITAAIRSMKYSWPTAACHLQSLYTSLTSRIERPQACISA